MKGIKRIIGWSYKFLPLFIAIIVLSILLQWFYSYLPLFVQAAFQALQGNKIDVALPSFLINLYNSTNEILKVILLVSLSMIILQAIRSVMRFVTNYSQGALAQFIGYDMRIKMYRHICDLPFSYHSNADVGDLIQRTTTDIDQISGFVSQQLPGFINIFVTVGIGALQVFNISPLLMFASIAILPITATASIIYFRYCNKQFDLIEQAESDMTTIIQENVNSSRVVRAFSNENYEFKKMDKASLEFSRRNEKFNTVMAIFWGISDGSVMLQYILTLATGIYLAKNGSLGPDDIAAAMLLMNMLIWPMRGLGRTIASFGKASVAANRIGDILDLPDEFAINGKKRPRISGSIEFKDVSFCFEDDNKHLLNGISFKINKGQTVALVGKTGSGKSTICNILVRFLEYDSGSVLIDGAELKEIDKRYLRENIKYILQDPFLFTRSIYDNIAISNAKLPQNQIYKAAEIASIHSEVIKFEKGYETIVGEKGTTLSGGQKQRVAIARMLVSESPIIIFDDSLSALDTKTDVMIRKALKLKDENQTTIIITHRITTAKEADLILVLDNGRIAQSGKHEELIGLNGLYKELWDIQGNIEDEFVNIIGDKE